jgi:hypothetical protein
MPINEIRASGLEAQRLATELLQRARRADPLAGLWEAADIQWWWRSPRPSDEFERLFWLDDQGPVAGVLLTSWRSAPWPCDPIVVPGAYSVDLDAVWARAMEHAARYAPDGFNVPVGDDDSAITALARRSGLTPAIGTVPAGWMPPTVLA